MSGRRLGLVLALGVATALLIEITLRLALSAVRIEPVAAQIPALVFAKGRWLAVAGLVALVAPAATRLARRRITWQEAWELAAVILIVAPLVWLAATWAVFAARMTVANAWSTDGRILLESSYYAGIVTETAPWLLAGAMVRGLASHAGTAPLDNQEVPDER